MFGLPKGVGHAFVILSIHLSATETSYTSLAFSDAIESAQACLQRSSTANLLIIDQFGLKAVNSRVFQQISTYTGTDMLFFISSGNIRRFCEEESIQKYFSVSKEELYAIPAKEIHRFICREYYRGLIPKGTEYYTAPFSIRKDKSSNIYGVIFGSGHLLGLEKFLRVSWKLDQATGEANYDIDDDIIWHGQGALFPEDRVVKKLDRFERELTDYLSVGLTDNRMIYKFTLENGFLPKHAIEVLRRLRREGRLRVDYRAGIEGPSEGFHLNSKSFKEKPLVVFSTKDLSHGAK